MKLAADRPPTCRQIGQRGPFGQAGCPLSGAAAAGSAGVLTSSTSEGVLKAREVTYRLTEPVIAPVRRVLKPVRLGGVQIDLAFTVVFFATLILRSIVTSF